MDATMDAFGVCVFKHLDQEVSQNLGSLTAK